MHLGFIIPMTSSNLMRVILLLMTFLRDRRKYNTIENVMEKNTQNGFFHSLLSSKTG